MTKLTTEQLNKKYGVPTPQGNGLVSIKLPYPLLYDGKEVKTMRCHNMDF